MHEDTFDADDGMDLTSQGQCTSAAELIKSGEMFRGGNLLVFTTGSVRSRSTSSKDLFKSRCLECRM